MPRGLSASIKTLMALLLMLLCGGALAQEPGAIYEGYYNCAQGRSSLILTAQPRPSSLSPDEAIFEFGPTPDNPNQPAGSFLVSGAINATAIDLKPVRWIKQPPGYAMVGLSGTSPDQGRTYSGTIVAAIPGCTTFLLARLR
jgi:hypothetical protein